MTGQQIFHVVFSPKYRHPILTAENRYIIFGHIRHIAQLKNIHIIALATDDARPDHVHLLIQLPPSMSIAKAVQLLKWYSSLYSRRDIPELKATHSRKALWQKRYYSTTVGIDHPKVQKYIEMQNKQTKETGK